MESQRRSVPTGARRFAGRDNTGAMQGRGGGKERRGSLCALSPIAYSGLTRRGPDNDRRGDKQINEAPSFSGSTRRPLESPRGRRRLQERTRGDEVLPSSYETYSMLWSLSPSSSIFLSPRSIKSRASVRPSPASIRSVVA
ncbi:hypothetical protein MTO96_027479 [Rhipicephalus appendiculatus]